MRYPRKTTTRDASASPPAAAPCYLPFNWWHPEDLGEAIKITKWQTFSHKKLCKHLNINKDLLLRLLGIVVAQLPAVHDLFDKDDICAVLGQIQFPPEFHSILNNAKYNKEHIGFLLWNVYLTAVRKDRERKRRNGQYARLRALNAGQAAGQKDLDAGQKDAMEILHSKFDHHGLSIHSLRQKVCASPKRLEKFGATLEMLSEGLANFENELAISIALRALEDEEADDLESLFQDQVELSANISGLEDDLVLLESLDNDIERFEQLKSDLEMTEELGGDIEKFEHELRDKYSHLLA